jgi:glycosyltransferase involved in cell wall biosynthesis
MLRVIFDDEIFTAQLHGGVSRAFTELSEALAAEPGVAPMLPFPLTANRHLAGSPVFHGRVLGDGRRIPGLRRLMRPINRRAVAAALARGQADILHATWYDATLADRAADIPLVLTLHDMLPELMPDAIVGANGAPHGDKLALLDRARRVVAVSAATALDLCRLTGLPRDAVRVIHHGVSGGLRWQPSDGRPPDLPDRFLLLVGQRGGYKNFAGIAPSLARLLRCNAGLHVVCAGGGAMRAEELEPFVRFGVARRVRQIEADDRRLAGCYAHAVAFVFPSLYEGFGMPLLEAMINGCPVICSNRGALPEIGAEAAIYFDPAEPDQLIELVEALDRDRPHAAAQISRGLRRAADFSWHRAAAAHAALYRELL